MGPVGIVGAMALAAVPLIIRWLGVGGSVWLSGPQHAGVGR